MIHRLLVTISLILAAGCLPVLNRTRPSVPGDPSTQASFCGIVGTLNQGQRARLLIIHGIGWHESYNYDVKLRDALTAHLKLEPIGCSGPYPISHPHDPFNVYGGVQRCTYKRADGALLRTYSLLWSPLTMPYKVGALQYDWERPHSGRRVKINRLLKRDLIDRSFSDAVLYSGALNTAMKYSVRQAICAAMTDETELMKPCSKPLSAAAEAGDLFIATHSLGSIMLFETLGEIKTTPGDSIAAEELIRRVRLVAMMANQLPLVGLARIMRPPEDSRLAPEFSSLPALLANRNKNDPVAIAAFSDANDLLSFPIPENWKDVLFPEISVYFNFVNFPVVNARSAILGVFANPAQAHSGYWRNDQVVTAIADGHNCR